MVVLLSCLDEPKKMTTLATACNTTTANMTGIVDGLVNKEWVERKDDETDRRAVVIHITPSGISDLKIIVDSLNGMDEGQRTQDDATTLEKL